MGGFRAGTLMWNGFMVHLAPLGAGIDERLTPRVAGGGFGLGFPSQKGFVLGLTLSWG
jgi:hypothetical protein